MKPSAPAEDRASKRQRLLALLESDDQSAAAATAAAAASATVGKRIHASIDGKLLYSRLDGHPATGADLNVVDAYVSALVGEGGSEQAAAARKLKDKSVVISSVKRSEAWDALRQRMDGQRPRTKNRITSRERRKLGLYDLKDSNLTYAAMQPLHDMWVQYFTAGVIDGSRNPELVLTRALKVDAVPHLFAPRLIHLQADFHGARVYVEQASSPQLVGIAGIVAMETENTFKIVRENDDVCTVPKRGCTFRVCVGTTVLRLYGRAICQRSADRAGKKFKSSRKSALL